MNKKLIITLFSIFLLLISTILIVKYNCEKLHQEIMYFGEDGIGATYLVNSKIRNNSLYIDAIGPISKVSYTIVDKDIYINLYVKSKDGINIGNINVINENINKQQNTHITFSTVIPNITWIDKLKSFELNIKMPYRYYSNNFINDDKSNLMGYIPFKKEKVNPTIGNTNATWESALNIVRALNKKEIYTTPELQEQLGHFKDGEKLTTIISFNDKGDIVIGDNGKFYNETELEIQVIKSKITGQNKL